ncbi:uncharacterized protein LOC117323645 [Pecten maximus]|uniref:uncharacterized protein LOC117323645 n=1 Tax=Pecten maximus TaxID=6579 RepID=UPI0014585D5E|nr:uncharacterized protein LOC117323645 [Pecten maximus]
MSEQTLTTQQSNEKPKKTFEKVVASLEALSVDTKKIFENYIEVTDTYYVGHEPLPFDVWLEAKMPSIVRRDGDFIGVLRPSKEKKRNTETEESKTDEDEEDSKTDEDEEDSKTDEDKEDCSSTDEDSSSTDDDEDEEEDRFPPHVMKMMYAFSKAIDSGQEVTKQLLFDLAKRFDVTSGKWMLIPVTTGLKVDVLWTKVARAIAEGSIPCCHYAKVSTMTPEKLNSNAVNHVICIYNNDFLNLDEVRDLESGIRSIGIRGKLSYKPDIFTYCGVYRRNQWGISPIIYQSNYDIKSKQSKIDLF